MFIESATVAVPCGQTDAGVSNPTGGGGAEGEEAGLVARLRAGDEAAFAELVAAHAPHLSAVARRYLSCEADAEDAVQEAFVAAWANIDRFKGDSRLSTWLHRIVVNAALMARRKRVRRREVLASDRGEGQAGALDGGRDARVDEGFGEERRAAQGRAGAILAEIRELPACHREVLELRYVQHQSTERASAALGVTPGALKTKLHRAKSHLLGRLAGEAVPGRARAG